MNLKIGNNNIDDRNPCFIIAEIASAHQGDIKECKKIVERFSNVGADAIKFQVFNCEELATHYNPKYQDLKKIEITPNEWKDIISFTKKFNIQIVAETFDEQSTELMVRLDVVVAFKLSPTNITNPEFISHLAKKGKPIMVAIGGSTLEEVKEAISIIKGVGNDQIALIHGFQAYPTEIKDTELKFMQMLKKQFNLPVGFHDHVDAESTMATILPAAAVAAGASLVEKHVTLDRKIKGYDYQSALHPSEFRTMVEYIRSIECAFGKQSGRTSERELSDSEKHYRLITRKNIVAKRRIKKDSMITEELLSFKRAGGGLFPSEAKKIIGKRAKKDIEKDDIISEEDVL